MDFETPLESKDRRPFAALQLDAEHQILCYAHKKVHVTQREAEVLALLKNRQGGLVTNDEFMAFAYDDPEEDLPLSNVLPQYIKHLREKIKEVTDDSITIQNELERGYRLAFRDTH